VSAPAPVPIPAPVIDLSFHHSWQAQILPARPIILPARHFVYPRDAEEVERGALEVLIRPEEAAEKLNPEGGGGFNPRIKPTGSGGASAPEGRFPPGAPGPDFGTWEETSVHPAPQSAQPFLATCALGFRDPAVPTGIWSTPKPEEICAVSGGYAYLIDTSAPERFTMISYRPVLHVRPLVDAGLLLFVGHHSILTWSRDGHAWESEKLSDEGVTIASIEANVLRGIGWQMRTDKETPFALDLLTGILITP
jgi:hypothetical protein